MKSPAGNQKLVIVESPGKIKSIQSYLGPDYKVVASYGHVADLVKKGLGVDVDNGFLPKYAVIDKQKARLAAINDAAKMSQIVYLATDRDREGEAIAFHLRDHISANVPFKRMLFGEITKQELLKAVADAGPLDKHLYDAQQARRILDRLVGFMVTPYLWSAFGPNCSAGRVQSVCLKLIVEREIEIENFKPEVYFSLTAALAKSNKSESFTAKYSIKLTDENKAKKIKTDLDGSTFEIINIEQKPQSRSPYPPLITSTLQQVAAGRFKLSTKKIMEAAQGLYEQGLISYMRTDSVRSSPESIKSVRGWLKDNKFDLPASPNAYKSKGTAQDAHEAIRPTNIALQPSSFSGPEDQKKIYQLIWERFVSSQMKPAIYDTVVVDIKASKGNHILKANGRTLQYAGWLSISKMDAKQSSDDVDLPPLSVKDKLILVPPKVKLEKKETKPPPRYNEGSLTGVLDKKGIGRPSTYSAIMSKITERNYVIKSKNVFTPTPIGRQVAQELAKFFAFMNYDYTKEMEEKLDLIEVGKLDYHTMLANFFGPFKNELRSARSSLDKDGGHDCDLCGKRMKLKHSQYGFFIACSGYPTCKSIKGVELNGEEIIIRERHQVVDGTTCPICSAGMVRRDGRFGPFYSCSKYPQCKGSRKIPFGKKCSKCGSELYLTIFKEVPKLACMGYPNCRNIEDVPPGTQINWMNPKKLARKGKKSKPLERILSK